MYVFLNCCCIFCAPWSWFAYLEVETKLDFTLPVSQGSHKQDSLPRCHWIGADFSIRAGFIFHRHYFQRQNTPSGCFFSLFSLSSCFLKLKCLHSCKCQCVKLQNNRARCDVVLFDIRYSCEFVSCEQLWMPVMYVFNFFTDLFFFLLLPGADWTWEEGVRLETYSRIVILFI